MKKNPGRILSKILLKISPSYRIIRQLKRENKKLFGANKRLGKKIDLVLKGQASLTQVNASLAQTNTSLAQVNASLAQANASIRSIGNDLSELSNDFTDILLLNKDRINHDVVKHLHFDRIGDIKVSYSVFDTSYHGNNHFFNEALGSNSKDSKHPYNFSHIDFKEGDVVIDIGGNLGLTSICLARLYPFLRIYCFEPVAENFGYLVRNLEMNHITNVQAFQLAVTSDGREMEFTFNETRSVRSGNVVNAQMAASYHPRKETVRSIAFDEVFSQHDIRSCKLLKIDCEGFEYEILNHTGMLPRIEYISGETHGGKDETIALFKHLKKHIPREKMAFTVVGSRKGNYSLGEIDEDDMFA